MRIVILGGGGIGSIVAAFFARAGHDVTLVTRGAHLDAVRERGITVTGLAEFTADVAVAERADGAVRRVRARDQDARHPRRARRGATAWRRASRSRCRTASPRTTCSRRSSTPVVGATTMVGATRTAPGAVAYTLDGATYVGAEAAALADAWNATGLQMTVVEDILGHEWAKQALQGPAATLAVASDLPNHLVHLRLARPFAEALREVAAVARAAGVELAAGEDYGFDVRAIADRARSRTRSRASSAAASSSSPPAGPRSSSSRCSRTRAPAARPRSRRPRATWSPKPAGSGGRPRSSTLELLCDLCAARGQLDRPSITTAA